MSDCTITIKWRFGQISLAMFGHQVSRWRSIICSAFDSSFNTESCELPALSEPVTRCDAATQTCNEDVQTPPNAIITCSEMEAEGEQKCAMKSRKYYHSIFDLYSRQSCVVRPLLAD